jgi:hypothetical protein
LSIEETELDKLINKVDHSFAEAPGVPLVRLVWLGIIAIFVASIGFLAVGSYFATVGTYAVGSGVTDLGISVLALGTSISALGITAAALIVALIVSSDLVQRMRGLRADFHYKRLKVCGEFDPVTLHALIEMKTMLPKDVTLKQTKTANPDLFSENDFARRLLEP